MKRFLVFAVALLMACGGQTKVDKMRAITFIVSNARIIVSTRLHDATAYLGNGSFASAPYPDETFDKTNPDTITVLYPDSTKVYRFTEMNGGFEDSLIAFKDTVWQPNSESHTRK